MVALTVGAEGDDVAVPVAVGGMVAVMVAVRVRVALLVPLGAGDAVCVATDVWRAGGDGCWR